MPDKPQLIVALDVDTFDEARILIDSLASVVDIFKVGSQLFTACGPVVVRHVLARGKKVFLDLKYHDIPNTVANAVSAAVALSASVHEVLDEKGKKKDAKQGLFMMTVHIQGGEEMLKMAVEAATKAAQDIKVTKPFLVGITVLTSDEKTDNIRTLVLERARLAKACGLDGVVASCEEAEFIRKEFGKDFLIVTPGIRPAGAQAQDQKRVATPREAVLSGSDFLVVGRPVVKAANPLQAAKEILKEMG
ncbi:MAG TPA: orotidine-5'-phosphate decarboxylase [Candidatus Omnitrophota bacterium]|nr:orotidine-5'-phosphate decarboxylase [Candidatus Omnitrophota bacterium]